MREHTADHNGRGTGGTSSVKRRQDRLLGKWHGGITVSVLVTAVPSHLVPTIISTRFYGRLISDANAQY